MADNTMHFVVAAPPTVKRDFLRNLPWFVGVLAVSLLYVFLSAAVIRVWETGWGFWHACYFTVINTTTVGFGDVTPTTTQGRFIASVNGIVGLLLFGALVALVALAFQPASWSASLTQAPGVRPGGEPSQKEPSVEEQAIADILAGLATLIRAPDRQSERLAKGGRVHIHVHGDGPRHARVEVSLHVDAD